MTDDCITILECDNCGKEKHIFHVLELILPWDCECGGLLYDSEGEKKKIQVIESVG